MKQSLVLIAIIPIAILIASAVVLTTYDNNNSSDNTEVVPPDDTPVTPSDDTPVTPSDDTPVTPSDDTPVTPSEDVPQQDLPDLEGYTLLESIQVPSIDLGASYFKSDVGGYVTLYIYEYLDPETHELHLVADVYDGETLFARAATICSDDGLEPDSIIFTKPISILGNTCDVETIRHIIDGLDGPFNTIIRGEFDAFITGIQRFAFEQTVLDKKMFDTMNHAIVLYEYSKTMETFFKFYGEDVEDSCGKPFKEKFLELSENELYNEAISFAKACLLKPWSIPYGTLIKLSSDEICDLALEVGELCDEVIEYANQHPTPHKDPKTDPSDDPKTDPSDDPKTDPSEDDPSHPVPSDLEGYTFLKSQRVLSSELQIHYFVPDVGEYVMTYTYTYMDFEAYELHMVTEIYDGEIRIARAYSILPDFGEATTTVEFYGPDGEIIGTIPSNLR